jgi:predicted transcriptional regulator of viral defense system
MSAILEPEIPETKYIAATSTMLSPPRKCPTKLAIAPSTLVDYALRLDVGAVVRRLGFLLETFEVPVPAEIDRLRAKLTSTYALLDPLMAAEGPYQARWRLRVNVEPDELRAMVRT